MHAVEYYISYTQVGLVRYKVDRVEAMADLETEYRQKRAVQLEQQRLLRVFKDPHKRRANARVRRAKKLKVDKKAVGYDSSESEQEGDTSKSEQGDAESPDGHSTITDGQGESSQEDAVLLAAPESEDEGAKEDALPEIGKDGRLYSTPRTVIWAGSAIRKRTHPTKHSLYIAPDTVAL